MHQVRLYTDTAVCQTPQMLKAHINALDVEVMNPDEVANEVRPWLTVVSVMPSIHCPSACGFLLTSAQQPSLST